MKILYLMNIKKSEKQKREYFWNRYPQIWSKQVNIYGYGQYQRDLVKLVTRQKDFLPHNRILESCIGTGYPIALNLQKNGFHVFGIDIAVSLIRECRRNSSEIESLVADAEKLPFKDGSFSLTYCFQSSWYLPNIEDAIGEMFRVATQGGIICFDIMNRLSPNIIWTLDIPEFKLGLLNLFRAILRKEPRRSENYRTTSSPKQMGKIIKRFNPSNVTITTPTKLNKLSFSKLDFLSPRLIYICKK